MAVITVRIDTYTSGIETAVKDVLDNLASWHLALPELERQLMLVEAVVDHDGAKETIFTYDSVLDDAD